MPRADEQSEQAKAPPADRLAAVNTLLAEWAACSAAESAPLIERLERMGYEVRGKSREDIAEALKHPPTHVPAS